MVIKKRVYICGLTPSGEMHLGHIRLYCCMSFFTNLLFIKSRTHLQIVSNFTDIDPKIQEEAERRKITQKELVTAVKEDFYRTLVKFDLRLPTKVYSVTENLEKISKFHNQIPKKYFEEREEGTYFEFKNLPAEEYLAKEDKKNFLLWDKRTNLPGWHTECATFVFSGFREEGVDFHFSGVDLKFPHNENESLLFKLVTKNKLSKQWFFVGPLNKDQEKMSKTRKNYILGKDFPSSKIQAFKFFLLQKSFFKPLEYSEEEILKHGIFLEKINLRFKNYFLEKTLVYSSFSSKLSEYLLELSEELYRKNFRIAFLNFSKIPLIFKRPSFLEKREISSFFLYFNKVCLGILSLDLSVFREQFF